MLVSMTILSTLLVMVGILMIALALQPVPALVFGKEKHLKTKRFTFPPWGVDLLGAIAAFALSSLLSGSVLIGLIAPPFGVLLARRLPEIIAKWRLFFLRRKLLEELEGACIVISSSVRSGMTLLEAYRTAASLARDPLRRELQTVVEEVEYGGKPLEKALKAFAERWKASETEILAHATAMAVRVGGSEVPNIMASVANSVRERKQMEKKIRAKTLYQRISAVSISLIPIVILFTFKLMSPELYRALVFEAREFFFVGVILTLAGWIMVFKIMNIEEF